MATAEELLMSVSDSDSESKICVIDNDLRTINIPKTITALGVEADDDVHRLVFQMPQNYCGIDLSDFSIRINYMNANNEGDIYIVTDNDADGSTITFSWLVGRNALAYKGDVNFIVCLKLADPTTAEVLQEFNTTVATLPVLEGLEVDPAPLSGELTDLLAQLEAVKAQAIFDIQDESQDQDEYLVSHANELKAEIHATGAEVLATIPADYTTAVNMIDNADRTKADAIICSPQGESISVSDSSDDYLRGLRVFGKTTQVSTTGAQLADYTGGNTASGVTKSFLNDILTVTGDGSLPYQSWSVDIKDMVVTHPGETLYFDYESLTSKVTPDGTVVQLNITKSDDTKEYIALYSKSGGKGEYSIPDDTGVISTISLSVYTSNNATSTANVITIAKPMLQIGTDKLVYEPYSGGYTSPSPSWSQDLVSVENPEITIGGKNLIPSLSADVDNQGVIYTLNDDGSITMNGTATAYSCCCGVTIEAISLRGKTLTLRGASDEGTKDVVTQIKFTLSDDSYIFRSISGKPYGTMEVPMGAETMRFEAYVSTGTTVSNFTVYPQLVLGTDLPEYEPYISKQAISAAEVLRGISVETDSSHTDENGKQWIGDEVDYGNGIYRQRVVVYEFDGSDDENWGLGYSSDGLSNRFQIMISNLPVAHEILSTNVSAVVALNALCSHFEYQRTSMIPSTNGFRVSHSITAETDCWYLLFNPDTSIVALEDLDAWKTYLTENPITVMLPLATPVETALTADELAAYNVLHTNYPNTVVLNDAGAHMELKYNADTQTYLENCYRPTNDQVQASVDTWLASHYTEAEGVSF